MPLTGAERAKKFREKLKEDPARYEIYKQKQREMVGKRRKKIADFDDNEKEKLREQWRKQKRSQKERKKESTQKNLETIPTPKRYKQSSKLKLINKKLQKVYSENEKSKKIQQKLNTVICRLRKQLTRTRHRVKLLESAETKTKNEFENLKKSVQETYAACKTIKDKRLLKEVAFKFTQKSGNNSRDILGLKNKIKCFNRRSNNNNYNRTLKDREITAFYLRDDVSRCAAGRKECKTRNKQKMQIRYLLDTLQNSYHMYVQEGGKVSFTTFYRCKPFYVISPTRAARDTYIVLVKQM